MGEPRVAIVTGAGHGIGLATAHALADAGYHVVVAERDDSRGEAAADAIEGALFLHCDVACEADVATTVAATVERFGGIDALVNNVGVGRGNCIAGARATTASSALATTVTSPMWRAPWCSPRLALDACYSPGGAARVAISSGSSENA